ncbi:putative chromatin remodeling & transcriptional activation CHROMO-DOMAIN family [Rosa chinensis]|nr:putative chromatin remodeling & transcriptional activation CHROMO-DOMAIN family [Rosa chinensis]
MVLVKLLPEQLRFLRSRDKRLFRKYEGPLPIIAKVGKCSYKVDIPAWMRVHPVFHVSNLKPHQPDCEDQARNQPVREHVDIRPPKPKEVEEILAERVIRVSRRPCQQFLVKWKSLGDEETSWENADVLKKKFQQKIEDFKIKAVVESADSLSGGGC